jgi:hypothetical protein
VVVAAVVVSVRRAACYQGLEAPCWLAYQKVLRVVRCPRFQSRMPSSTVTAQWVLVDHATWELAVDRP